MKLPFKMSVDIGLKAKWDDIDYCEMITTISKQIAKEWQLNNGQEFDLNVVIGNAFRAGYLAGKEDEAESRDHKD